MFEVKKGPTMAVSDSLKLTNRTEQILDHLESDNGWRSGQDLSNSLGISRAAIAKRIAALRELGHAIDSAPRRGYKLLVKAESLSRELVEQCLVTEFIGRADWHILAKTESTNNIAVELAAKGAPEGTIVIAERQTLGRGRKAENWFSTPRALQFSILLRPSLPASALNWLIPAGTVAMAEAIEQTTSIKTQVKKPNDVLIKKRKVAGILAEAKLRGGMPEWIVLGIGCNVNALAADFPPELHGAATSILMETGTPTSRAKLLATTINRLEFWYKKLLSDQYGSLENHWNAQN